ncbi:polysaccharide biosynthesis tyrosine autokinase [Sporichthya polymorpha]|uniref:polysaccharide biosynthesis tyrosine autokinase n=1 Tax=Sporichthya polymorpha TaxID=35751 RepID=UPI00039A6F31|nr:polysaccharide biosynthesis tyrosine autokinase [Sporichthya polymorpha]
MTFQDYVRVLRERWLLVVFGLILGVTGAGAHAFLATEQYSTSATFFIATTDLGDDVTKAYQGSLLSEQKIKSYTELATGRRMKEQVEQVLGAPLGSASLGASARPDTVLLTISVTDPSPQRAQRIAQIASTEFVALVNEVEKPVAGGTPAVTAKIVQTPTLPDAPVSPKPARDFALGIVLGAMLGVGLAVLRHTLDRSVKTTDALSALVEAPVMGATSFDPDVKTSPLVVFDAPQSGLAESFRQLRTNLQYVDLDNTAKLIVVTSSLPSEGKTTTSCNLAIALAQGGARVALVEADLRRPKAAHVLGLDNAVGLTNVLTGQLPLASAIQPWGDGLFDFLGSGPLPPNPSELLASRQMGDVLDELGRNYDIVLFDAPPTLPVADAAVLTAQCHGALFIARHGKVTLDQVRAAADTLHRVSANVFGVILTMAPRSKGKGGYYYEYGYSAAPGTVVSSGLQSSMKVQSGKLRSPRTRKAIEAQQAGNISEAETLLRAAGGAMTSNGVVDWVETPVPAAETPFVPASRNGGTVTQGSADDIVVITTGRKPDAASQRTQP